MSSSARETALACVREVMVNDAYANVVMPQLQRTSRLSSTDAAFAVELAYGALRMSGWYDQIIESAASRKPTSLDPTVRWILWLGAHQHLRMRVPTHAVVNETVRLAKRHASRASGLVNAVMRRISERTAHEWQELLAPGSSLHDLAARHSHPHWVALELERALDRDGRADELEHLLESHNEPAPVSLVARPGLLSPDELLQHVPGGRAGTLSPWSVVMPHGDPGAVAPLRDGRAGVQDEGSQIAAGVLALHGGSRAGERWWDACAGPGGKAALLATMAHQAGATLLATEIHSHRVDLIRSGLRAVPQQHLEIRQADASQVSDGPFDRILMDVPCTGLGALRRRPEARWRRQPSDLRDLTALQRSLRDNAVDQLAPHGLLVYVTCSPVVAETTDIVDDAPGVMLEDIRPTVASLTGTTPEAWGAHPWVQLWPHRHSTDAMFIAALRKSG